MHFDLDPDVTRARTLDKRFYLDPEAWALARERIFARAWVWIGDLADVAAPASLSPRTLLPGLLDEPLLLARDDAPGGGTLRGLSNVCTHRGNLLVQQAATGVKGIRCGYHARRFDLAGRMTFMPGFEGACNFPSAADHLPEVAFGAWQGHGFAMAAAAQAAPGPPLAEVLAPVTARTGLVGIDGWRHDPARDRQFEFDAHWALYVENYLEGLHIPHLHPGLAATLDMAGYRYELFPWCNLQVARARPGEPAFATDPLRVSASATDPLRVSVSARDPLRVSGGEPIGAYYFWVWPNLMLNFYPWGLSVNLVLPLSPTRTRVLFRGYVRDPSLTTRGAGGALDPVEMEDEAAVLTVQQGLRSRFYDRGRYSPRHERGVHHFHRLVAQAMAAG